MRYQNPIIPGFHPDPSICRMGEDYYLVTSSFEFFPGVPVFHSHDLINWRQIGHCLSRPSQLPLRGARSSGGIFAPAIRCHQGRFYMITTNVTGGGHFFVQTQDPAGEWSEPVWISGGGIDPSLFFDDDGVTYFTYTTGGQIVQREVNIETGAVGEEKQLWAGTGGQNPEGPHLYKIGGRYYLLISEGGTEYGHMLTIARSSSPWGPFEACPRNPILTHRSQANPIQATGHGDLVEDGQGNWWVVFLGIRPNGHWPYHHLGRETFLAPVIWDTDDWPVIGESGQVALEMDGPGQALQTGPARSLDTSFDQSQLALEWNFLRNPEDMRWSLTERPGFLRLYGSETGLDQVGTPAWIGRRQEHFEICASVGLEYEPQTANEEAGLVVWMNERHHYETFLSIRGGQRCVVARRRIGSLQAEVACIPVGTGPVTLEVRADRSAYHFLVYRAGEETMELATGEARYLATEVAGGFTGMYLAMYASGNGQMCKTPADFAQFDYSWK